VVTAVGMLTPSPDVFLVMRAEVVTILGAEMVIPAALTVVIPIVGSPIVIVMPAVIISPPVLRDTSRGGERQGGCQHGSV